MLSLLQCISTADTLLARATVSTFSHQLLMETLISGFSSEHFGQFTDAAGEFLDACDWPGIECNEAKDILYIDWISQDWVNRPISLDGLPPTLLGCNLGHPSAFDEGELIGTLSAALLPRALEILNIERNAFFGSIAFASLPSALCMLNVRFNNFVGSVDLCALPQKLKFLTLAHNNFCGEIDRRGLPSELGVLRLESNAFEGTISIDSLPKTLYQMDVSSNELSGRLDFSNLPVNLQYMELSQNNFDAVDGADVPKHVWLK